MQNAGALNQPGTPVIFLSVDGLMPEHIFNSEKYNLKIPHIKKLLKLGAYATGVEGVLPTLTYPTHVTMLTGVTPSQHGIVSNWYQDPTKIHDGAWMWFTSAIKVPTLWDLAHDQGLKVASVDFPVSVGAAKIDFLIPQFWRDSTPLDIQLIRSLSTPGLWDEMEGKLGALPSWDFDNEGDHIRAQYISYLLEKKKIDFLTGYFASVDHNAHLFGPFSKETSESIEKVDAHIGRIYEWTKSQKAHLIIISDHGFIPIEKEIRLNLEFIKAGLSEGEVGGEKKGKLKSYQAFAWANEGASAIYINPAADQISVRRKLKKLLAQFQKKYRGAIEQVIEGEEVKKFKGFPGADFILLAGTGYTFSDSLIPPMMGAKPKYKATHGHSSQREEMNAIFIAAGPGIAEGQNLGKIKMIDVAPSVSKLLEVKCEKCEGQSVFK